MATKAEAEIWVTIDCNPDQPCTSEWCYGDYCPHWGPFEIPLSEVPVDMQVFFVDEAEKEM